MTKVNVNELLHSANRVSITKFELLISEFSTDIWKTKPYISRFAISSTKMPRSREHTTGGYIENIFTSNYLFTVIEIPVFIYAVFRCHLHV